MRIVGIGFDQVKSFGEPQSMGFSALNLLYGANSAGKSSVFQVLTLLKQSTARAYGTDAGRLEFRGHVADLGGFRTFIHNHRQEAVLSLTLALADSDAHEQAAYFGQNAALGLQFGVVGDDHEARLLSVTVVDDTNPPVRFAYNPETESLRVADAASAKSLVDRYVAVLDELPKRVRDDLSDITDADHRWLRDFVRKSDVDLTGWIPHWDNLIVGRGKKGRPYGGSLGSRRGRLLSLLVGSWSAWATNFAFELYGALEAIEYVGPLREFPKRVVTEAVDARGLGFRGERLVLHLARHPESTESINEAFSVLEIPYRLAVERLSALHGQDALGDVAIAVLTDERTDLSVSPADVGFGLSQILPVVVQVLSNRNRLILVEQPEIHLHPKMQSRLADLLVQSCIQNGNTLLVETHSEHILHRAQRRIREGHGTGLTNDDVSVFFVTSDSGVAEILHLPLQENGDLTDPWPDGFFDDRLLDLFGGFTASEEDG